MKKIGWQVESLKDTSEVSARLPTLERSDCGLGDFTFEVKEARKIYLFIKRFRLFPWSIIKVLRAKKFIPLAKLKKFRPLLVREQPFKLAKPKFNGLKGLKFNKHNYFLIPTKTIWLELKKTETQLLKELKPKTRYNLKQTQNLKLKTQNCNLKLKTEIIAGNKITKKQLINFYQLWSKNKPFNWLFKPSFYELKALVESFGNKCFFVFIINQNSLLAAVLVLNSSNMSFYWHNCSSKEGKQLFAPTLCVWEAIMESKKRGLKIFDFEGVWDERYPQVNRGWLGFTRFKQGFGGEEIYFK